MNTKKQSVAEIITDIIIKKLEEGVCPWRKPWNGSANAPRNLVTGKAYRGINAFLLACTGFSSPYFLTFKQVSDKGGLVIKGAASFPVVFWSNVTVEDHETGDEKNIPFMRYYRVFSVEQTNLPIPPITENPLEFNPIEEAEKIIASMPNRPEIRYGQAKAYYSPTLDYINMPRQELFESSEKFYSVLFHEAAHASGHSSRLARKSLMESTYFGSHEYSKEELIAEMSAAFLCGEIGIAPATLDNSAAYIQSWLRALKSKDNKNMVITAAGAAQKAVDYILDRKPAALSEAA